MSLNPEFMKKYVPAAGADASIKKDENGKLFVKTGNGLKTESEGVTINLGAGLCFDENGKLATTSQYVHHVSAVEATGTHITPNPIAVLQGGEIVVTITADYGYQITDVKIDGESAGVIESYTFSNMTTSHVVETEAEALTMHDVTIETVSGGAAAANRTRVVDGDSVTITASPESGNEFEKFTDGDGNEYTANPLTIANVTEDITITPHFIPQRIYGFCVNGSDPAAILEGDAANMTETQRWELFKDVCGWKPCLYKNRDVQYYVKESNWGEKEDGTASDLTGTDGDFMRECKPIYVKYFADASGKHFQFSRAPFTGANQHPWLHDATIKPFYMGVYEATVIDGKLMSVNASAKPNSNVSLKTFRGYAAAKGDGYSVTLGVQWQFYMSMMVFVYGTRNLQAAVGYGFVNSSASDGRSNVNAGVSLTGGHKQGNTSSSSHSCVVAGGLVNPWGNVWEFKEGVYFYNGICYTATDAAELWDIETDKSTMPASWHKCNEVAISTSLSQTYITDVLADEYMPWVGSAHASGNSSSYYCDAEWSASGARCCLSGGDWSGGAMSGLFTLSWGDAPSDAAVRIGARLLAFSES